MCVDSCDCWIDRSMWLCSTAPCHSILVLTLLSLYYDHLYPLSLEQVLCGSRGSRETYRHSGNERFRITVELRLERYRKASSRMEKTHIVKEIVDAVRRSGGSFVRQEEDGMSFDIGGLKSREKAGHALRGALVRHAQRPQKEMPKLEHSTKKAAETSSPIEKHGSVAHNPSFETATLLQAANSLRDTFTTEDLLPQRTSPDRDDFQVFLWSKFHDTGGDIQKISPGHLYSLSSERSEDDDGKKKPAK
jgi:hypothetical protein